MMLRWILVFVAIGVASAFTTPVTSFRSHGIGTKGRHTISRRHSAPVLRPSTFALHNPISLRMNGDDKGETKDVADTVESFSEMVRRVTGKEDYKFGDLSKGSIDRLGATIQAIEKGLGDTVEATRKIAYSPDYQFGDLTVAAAKEVIAWGQKERAAFESLTGKEYEFGDLTKFVSKSVVDKTKEILGPDYQFGDLTKSLVKGASDAAASYKFGDISRGVMKMFQENVTPQLEKGMEAAGTMRLELLEQEKAIISQVLEKGSASGANDEAVTELLAQEMSYLESLCVDPKDPKA